MSIDLFKMVFSLLLHC